MAVSRHHAGHHVFWDFNLVVDLDLHRYWVLTCAGIADCTWLGLLLTVSVLIKACRS